MHQYLSHWKQGCFSIDDTSMYLSVKRILLALQCYSLEASSAHQRAMQPGSQPGVNTPVPIHLTVNVTVDVAVRVNYRVVDPAFPEGLPDWDSPDPASGHTIINPGVGAAWSGTNVHGQEGGSDGTWVACRGNGLAAGGPRDTPPGVTSPSDKKRDDKLSSSDVTMGSLHPPSLPDDA